MNLPTIFQRKRELATPLNNWFESTLTDFFADEFFRPFDFNTAKARAYPKVDISKDGNDILIEAYIPFCKKEDVSVNLEENILILSGKAEKIEETSDKYYFKQELARSAFTRSFPIDRVLYDDWVSRVGHEAVPDHVVAELKDGVLTIRLVGLMEAAQEDTPRLRSIEIRSVE